MLKINSAVGGVLLKMLIVIASLMMGIVVYLFTVRSNPVLYGYFESGNPVKEPVFTIFNPFRDRAPERTAEGFLKRLKDGDCERGMAGLSHQSQYQQETCEREKTYPLTAWRLRNRTDESQKVRMYYEVRRNNYGGLVGRVWLTVEKYGYQWHVTRYDRSY